MNKFIPIILILAFSCVEHKLFFQVAPDGSYQIEYKAHGDKGDLIDFDFTMPTGRKWTINSTLDETEADGPPSKEGFSAQPSRPVPLHD